MIKPMLWIVAAILFAFSLALFSFLLWEKLPPIQASSLALGDIMNLLTALLTMVGLAIALGSFYIAIAAYQKSVKDSEEQQKSLDASREQLQAVVETAKKQQEVLTQNLETSKALFTLQEQEQKQSMQAAKKQHELLTNSLETSKSLLTIQEEEEKRTREIANRKPKLLLILAGHEIDEGKQVTATLHVDKDNHALLQLSIKNVGLAPLLKPVHIAIASLQEISVNIKGAHKDPQKPYHSQLSGPLVLDILPFSTSDNLYEMPIDFTIPPPVSEFYLKYNLSSGNLDSPFKATIHIQVNRG